MLLPAIVAISIASTLCQGDSVIPLKYNITIDPDLQSLTFSADIIITIYVEASTQNVSLNRKNLNIKNVTLTDQGNVDIEGISFEIDDEAETLSILSTFSLAIGEMYDLKIIFDGVINQNQEGFYSAQYIKAEKERYNILYKKL